MYRIMPALEVSWASYTPLEETLLVPPTMLRISPTVIPSWFTRKYIELKTILELRFAESALRLILALYVPTERLSDPRTYHRESRPSVARSKGDIPMDSRMIVAFNNPTDWLWYIASWQQPPTIRTKHRIRAKIHPEERPKPWRAQIIVATISAGKYMTSSAIETPARPSSFIFGQIW
jgi:hypothetical protein